MFYGFGNLLKESPKLFLHGLHKHKSKEERKVCKYLMRKYGEENVVPNFKLPSLFRGFQIDFGIMKHGVLDHFIEFHPYSRGEGDQKYAKRRRELVRVVYGNIKLVVMTTLPKFNLDSRPSIKT